MKLLIDNNLSPQLAIFLRNQNIDVVHVKEIGKQSASDVELFNLAFQEERTIITADTDFSFLLSQWNFNLPSVILLRFIPYNSQIQFQIISNILSSFISELENGSIIVVEPSRIRIRNLPLM